MLTHGPFQPTPDSPDWDPKAVGRGREPARRSTSPTWSRTWTRWSAGSSRSSTSSASATTRSILFLGDNGTGRGVTSRFRGEDYPGGKGTTTRRGMHVPLIASWPAVIARGEVNRDLVSSVDFLPTLCEAAGVAVPSNVDGVSFLPQLRGEKRHAARVALLLVFAPATGGPDRARVRLRRQVQALPHRRVLRPGGRSVREKGTAPGLHAGRGQRPPPACRPCWTGSRTRARRNSTASSRIPEGRPAAKSGQAKAKKKVRARAR